MKKKHELASYGLIRKIIKQKTYSVGTIMLCQISPTLYAVLVYDEKGKIAASCCNDVGYSKSVKKASLKNLHKVYREMQEKLSIKQLDLIRN